MWLIATFPSKKYNIENFPAVKGHLLSFGQERLEQSGKKYVINGQKITARKKTNNKWFETQDSISYWDDFNKQKIVWARLMRISPSNYWNFPRFALIDKNFMIQDSLCFIVGARLSYLCSFLNSEIGSYYYFTNVVSLDNGGLQMRQQFIEMFPIPLVDKHKSDTLERILASSSDLNNPSIREKIDHIIFSLYEFTENEKNHILNFNSSRITSIIER